MEQILLNYAKEGVFLALFLYLLIWHIPRISKEFKQEMKEMEVRHMTEINRLETKHNEEIQKLEEKSEIREKELIRLLNMFEQKYEVLTDKVDQVLKKIKK